MKVKYLKSHFQHVAGDVSEELTDEGANYLIRVGVAEKIEETIFPEKEEITPKKEKKETKGVPTPKKK